MVITRTLDIDAAVSQLAYAAANLRRLAQDFDSLEGNETGLPELVKQLNMAVQQAGDARDNIEAAVDEYLNEGEDEFLDDEEDEGRAVCQGCGGWEDEHDNACPYAPWNDDSAYFGYGEDDEDIEDEDDLT